MASCYKKLWELHIDRDMTRADLRGATGIVPATIAPEPPTSPQDHKRGKEDAS